MPYRSKAQQRLFHSKNRPKGISAADVKEYDQATDFTHLPERKKPSRSARKK